MSIIHQEHKLDWIENLRVIAIVSVIFAHVASPILYRFGSISNAFWWIGNICEGSVLFCVPIFVMVTGALLLPKEYEISNFLKRRLVRVVIPFLIWNFVYTVYHLFADGINLQFNIILKFFFRFFLIGAEYHFWYVYMIIGIYLFIPIIGKWVRNCSEKEILYFLAIWLVSLFLNLPFLQYHIKINLSYFTGYIGFLVLGYYLSVKVFSNSKKVRIVSFVLIFVGVIATILGTYLFSVKKGVFCEYLYDCLTPNVLMVSIGVFLLIKDKITSSYKLLIFRNFISQNSYGIYLIHVLVLYLLSYFNINWMLLNPLIGIPLTTILCLIISIFMVHIINKLPYGKYVSG